MTKISDIAEKADVSITTVSLALNNKPGIGRETRNKILQVAKQLNYTKINKLRAGTFRLIQITKHGHTVNKDHDNFLSQYIEHISRFAQLHSFDVQLVSCGMEDIKTRLKNYYQGGVDGIIVIGTELSRKDVQKFKVYDMPIVFIDTFYPGLNFDFVDMDNVGAVYEVVNLLISKGHRDIGLISSFVDVENFRLREKAFHDILLERSPEIKITSSVFRVDSTYDNSKKELLELLKDTETLPTIFFCVNDIIALGCMHALNTLGYNIPKDISVIGFDNLLQSRMAVPPLSSVQVNHEKMSEYAVRLLLDRVVSPLLQSKVKISVGTSLVLRESVFDLS